TRSKRDWSSDVCSSDLTSFMATSSPEEKILGRAAQQPVAIAVRQKPEPRPHQVDAVPIGMATRDLERTVALPHATLRAERANDRSEERRVGKECSSRGT